jgi:hypothetical protein
VATEIIINLNDDRDAYVLTDPKDIIHVNELEQVRRLIEESINDAQDYEKSIEHEKTEISIKRKHDTIMLEGVRGSGKTTFMLSILNFIRNGINGTSTVSFKFDGKDNIEVLNIFDPTLIEDKVHVFINIISMIKDRVDEKAKKANCFIDTNSDDWRNYQEWEKSSKKLADGLPAIRGVGKNGFSGDEWLDSEFVMGKGVSRAHAANHLERNFHEFVSKSLKFIGKSAFLLCFDDIDTNFAKGWPVLEVLHKYLTTPQFITILSGDAHLYLILIRDQQWKNFSYRILQTEKENISRYKETVAHLEEQYFLKMLKPERRVFLNSLYHKEQQQGENKISVKGTILDDSLNNCYRRLMRHFGIFSGGQQYTIYRFLASTPLRTQKQLLCAFNDSQLPKCPVDIGNRIVEIFWSDLAEKKVNVSNLRNVPHYAIPQIVEYLVNNKLLIEGYTLSPVFSDHFVNGAQFALGTLITDRIKRDPSMIFEFWLKVCLTRELGALMEENTSAEKKGPSIEDFVDYCAVKKLRTPRYVARFATAYIRGFLGNQASAKYATGAWHGTLPLYGLAADKKVTERIDYELDKTNKNFFLRVMGKLPLSGATNHRGESLPVYSFYNLLGVLGELVLAARSTSNEEDAVREVRRTIVKNAQFREYPLPGWARNFSSDEDQADDVSTEEDIVIDTEVEKVSKSFATEIVNWATQLDDDFVISPTIMAKSFTRFFYASNNMDKELVKERKLGNWMHRMVIVFLNSVVVVEAMEKINLTNVKLNLKNPTKKDDIFIGNLKKINDYRGENTERLKLSKWILACPLWKIYMKDDFEFSDKFTDPDNSFEKFIFKQIDFEYDPEWRGLNYLLGHVQIRTAEPIKKIRNKKKTVRKANIDDLPSFRIDDQKCIETLLKEFTQSNQSPDLVYEMSDEVLTSQLKSLFTATYSSRSISKLTAKAVKDRIADGRLTW